jgi:hypothetical protein
MNAFIVRPFGTKRDIDFEAVERDLIAPALSRLDITGRTTAEITRAGNIRADMFQLLLIADIVIADMSIHNANVFYELGVRHALRDKRTLLIRASVDEVPFDLKTDRYLTYDPKAPGASLDALIASISATLREQVVDSPVYDLIPGLKAPDPTSFVVVPRDFREEVQIAKAAKRGGDLRFIASELGGLRWKREGRRVIANAQFDIKDLEYSAETWETIREELPDDVEANLRLGTIHQKLGDLVRSDLALQRVISSTTLDAGDLAEARALLGSNAKARWLADWRQLPDLTARQLAALKSAHLKAATAEYTKGFEAEPRHYYSGLNALAMTVVLTELAAAQPRVWAARFEDADDAKTELKKVNRQRTQLAGAVEFSLAARRQQLARAGKEDPWLDVSVADLAFLTARPNVEQLYTDAIGLLGDFAWSSVRRQVEIYEQLAVLPDAVDAVTPLFVTQAVAVKPAASPRAIVFTGHRIDAPDRKKPRFPASQETAAREAIRNAIRESISENVEGAIAMSGGASGGDILFLEVCEELGIPCQVYLIIPREDYVRESVAPSGVDWVRRFNRLLNVATVRVYQQGPTLPVWLQDKETYSIWERSNAWLLHNALWSGSVRTTLIALWDGEEGDGPGGTKHMTEAARGRGAQTIVLNTKELFGLSAKKPETTT